MDDRGTLDTVLDRLEELLDAVDTLPDADRANVVELLDRVDDLHRLALGQLGARLPAHQVEELRDAHPAVAWLFEAYGIGLDQRAAVDAALDRVRPYLHSHGGEVELHDVTDGVVTVQLTGACAGCSASAITLREGVEEALAAGVPGFARLEVVEDRHAAPHDPPGPTLLQIDWHPESAGARAR